MKEQIILQDDLFRKILKYLKLADFASGHQINYCGCREKEKDRPFDEE